MVPYLKVTPWKVIWIQSCEDCSSSDFPLAVLCSLFKVQPKCHLPIQVDFLPPASRMLCHITLLLSPLFLHWVTCLKPPSLQQGLIPIVFSALSTSMTHICQMDKFVELLKHWNKPWFAYQFLKSQIFYILY